MKKITSLLIGCSLALAGAALAQQPDEQQSPSKNKKQGEEKKTHAAEAKPGANTAKPEGPAAKQHGAMKERGATNERGAGKGRKTQQEPATAAGTGTNASGEPAASATPGAKQQAQEGRKGMKGRGAAAKTAATPAATAAAAASATPAAAAASAAAPATAASASAAPTAAAAGQQNAQANAAAGAAKKPDPQQVQQIKAQHANFRAQPKPQQVPAVTFNQSYRIQGSDRWQGPQYEVFRSYHPERHDQGWYRSRYTRVELIGGGYYYFNNGYWYPAWGYNPSSEYYAYDAPIYVGHRAEPPDQVIADVQGVLQQMGYYKGEVDGLLGPLTREALTAYQADQGLIATAVIDQPTLDSLGMG
jgi:Putative peptidoglycan binding domain